MRNKCACTYAKARCVTAVAPTGYINTTNSIDLINVRAVAGGDGMSSNPTTTSKLTSYDTPRGLADSARLMTRSDKF